MAGDSIYSQKGGRFSIEVKHNFGRGNLDLLDFLNQLDNKLRNNIIRKMVSAAGQLLVQEVRKQIAIRDMPHSRAKGKKKKQLKAEGTVPLKYTISKRVWSKPHKGIIGCVVGPTWPKGAHGHLVEFGHKITGHATWKVRAPSIRFRKGRINVKFKTRKIGRNIVRRGGVRTVAHEFQKEAMVAVDRDIFLTMAGAMSRALKAAGNPHIKAQV